MPRKNRRRSSRGESLVETVSSVFIVSIGVCGLAASSAVSVKSETMSAGVNRAAGTASGAVEDMRSAVKLGEWSRLREDFDQKRIVVDGAADQTKDVLLVRVSQTASDLLDSTGMWAPGAVSPNFLFVRIGAASPDAKSAGGAQMQTYIADGNLLGTGLTPGSVDTGEKKTSAAEQFATSLGNYSATGSSTRTTKVDVMNQAATTVNLRSATLTLPTGSKITKFSIGKSIVFSSLKNTTPTVTVAWTGTGGPALPPGLTHLSFQHSGDALTAAKAGTITFTFTDASSITWLVKP